MEGWGVRRTLRPMSKAEGLRVYHGARDLADQVIAALSKVRRRMPGDLRSQLESAANSIGANIAEGMGRGTRDDTLRYLRNARSSLDETRHHLRVCSKGEFIDRKTFFALWNRSSALQPMLSNLMATIGRRRR